MDVKPLCQVHIRWLIRRDLPQVLEIESGVPRGAWSEGKIIKSMHKRHHIGLVAEHGESIVGYAVYALFPQAIKVLRLAVAPEMRRARVGTQLIEKLAGKLSTQRRKLYLSVPESNLPLLLFLNARGFRATKVLRKSIDLETDAYVMQRLFEP
jgi:ribosomal-protein-alanine N-acetyltransferase